MLQTHERVVFLIDAQNCYHTTQNLYHRNPNFLGIIKEILGDRHLLRALAYVIATEKGDETAFLEALSSNGIELRKKDLQVFYDGAKKGDWDVGMAIDAVILAEKADTIVLVTGDGDFVPLVDYLRHKGVRVEIASFVQRTSQKLVDASHRFFNLSEAPSKFVIGGLGNNGRKHAAKRPRAKANNANSNSATGNTTPAAPKKQQAPEQVKLTKANSVN
ncbi:MAG TPA: NYN domain-containing protein [Candidatus Paceibacterota bacterium]